MKQRAFINMTLAVDLDMVPGTCHQPEDFVTFIEQALKGASHYNPEVSVQETVVMDYSWDDDKGYIRPEILGQGSVDHMPERNSEDAVDAEGCPTWA